MAANDFESLFVEQDGKRFHYTVHGEGTPLVLLHGGGPGASGLSNYRRNIDALAASHKLYVIDLLGYGRSSKDYDRNQLFEAQGDGVVAFMDGIGLQKASLVGNSLGGAAAIWAALKHPNRVDRLILMGPGGGFSPLSVGPSAGIVALVSYYLGEGPSMEKMKTMISNLVFNPASITPELLQERYQASLDPEVIANPPIRPPGPGARMDLWRQPGLASLPHRTLVIWGMEDKTNPPDAAFSFSKVIPNCELYLLPKCGHWAQWEKPDEFHDAVLTFLARP